MSKGKKVICFVCSCLIIFGIAGLCKVTSEAAIPSKKTLKLGTTYRIDATGATFSAGDTSVAYVDKNGVVTAKSTGKTIIRIKKGDTVRKLKLNVIANGNIKQGIGVSPGEVVVTKNQIIYKGLTAKTSASGTPAVTSVPAAAVPAAVTAAPSSSASVTMTPVPVTAVQSIASNGEVQISYTIRVTLENRGETDISKIVLTGMVEDEEYDLKFGTIKTGGTKTAELTDTVKRQELDVSQDKLELSKIKIYADGMCLLYNYKTKKSTYHYGSSDHKAPVISGFVEDNSYNQKMPYLVVYPKTKKSSYFKYVQVKDDRDKHVKLTVDTENVNYKKPGKYWVTYVAKDSTGNTTKVKAKIEVRREKTVDQYAGEVLSGIIKENWSTYRKATAIYNYTRGHITYVGYSNKSSWEAEAVHGIRYGRGDCFTYYAVARALLTKAGIPNIEVKRYRGAGHHWWNMIYVKGGWYHYDCGPRIGGGRFCMLTDAQLTGYSRTHGNKYIWNYKIMPKSPKKKLTSVF